MASFLWVLWHRISRGAKKIKLDVFENVPVEALFGQGVVDAGKLFVDWALSMSGG